VPPALSEKRSNSCWTRLAPAGPIPRDQLVTEDIDFRGSLDAQADVTPLDLHDGQDDGITDLDTLIEFA
jgi:hypothetical protein